MIILTDYNVLLLFIELLHIVAMIEMFHLLAVYNLLLVVNMVVAAAVILYGDVHLAIDQIQAEGYPCGACLCAYHTQYHHRQSGHFNELLFHNRVFYLFVVAGLGVALCL